MKRAVGWCLGVFLLISGFIVADLASPAEAFFNPFATPVPTGILAVPVELGSAIGLAEGGDLNGNGKAEAGEGLRYSYSITNPSQTTHLGVMVRTGVDKSGLHFIRNVRGVSSLEVEEGEIIFPNVVLRPQSRIEISFDAQVNYGLAGPVRYATQLEVEGEQGEFLGSGPLQELEVGPGSGEAIPSQVQMQPLISERGVR